MTMELDSAYSGLHNCPESRARASEIEQLTVRVVLLIINKELPLTTHMAVLRKKRIKEQSLWCLKDGTRGSIC